MRARDHPPRNNLEVGAADTKRDNMMTNRTSKRTTGEVGKEVSNIKMIIMAKINITDRNNLSTTEAIKTRDSSNQRKPFTKNDLQKNNTLKCFQNKTAG